LLCDLGRWVLLETLTGNNHLPNCFIVGTGSKTISGLMVNSFQDAAIIAPLTNASWTMDFTDPASTTSTTVNVTCTLNLPLNTYSGAQVTGTELMLVHYTGTVSTPQAISYSIITSSGIASNPSTISSSGYTLFAYSPVTGTYNIVPSSSVTLTWLWSFSINVG
jgi:hypothetical protein